MRNCYLISRSWFKFLDMYKFRDCNFFPWVHFANHLILRSTGRSIFKSNYELNGWLEFREGGYRYWIRCFGKVNEKEINETRILIFIFLNGILPLKIRSEKIRLIFIESNMGKDEKLFGWWMICLYPFWVEEYPIKIHLTTLGSNFPLF